MFTQLNLASFYAIIQPYEGKQSLKKVEQNLCPVFIKHLAKPSSPSAIITDRNIKDSFYETFGEI